MPITNPHLVGKKFGLWTVLEFKGYRNFLNSRRTSQYLCKCDCGTVKIVLAGSLIGKKSRSCGCIKRKPDGYAARNQVYIAYRSQARHRNIAFELNEDYFRELIKKNCFYCDSPPSNRSKTNKNTGAYIYTGIDRLDNNRSYIPENVVPCCKRCNLAKRQYSVKEFFDMVKRIYERHLK